MELRDRNGLTEQEFLMQYQPGDYEHPSVAADMVVFTVTDAEEDNYRKLPEKELRVLLIQRGGHPYLGCWALPGGFVRPGETAGQTARRELREETGVDRVYLEQLMLFTEPGRDPRTWVMSCAHMALVDSSRLTIQAGDDADNAAWFRVRYQPLNEDSKDQDGQKNRKLYKRLQLTHGDTCLTAVLESGDDYNCQDSGGFRIIENQGLAFDHAQIIAYALERLRKRVEETDIAFNLMPEQFALTELQQVFEIILDKPLLKAAFRRKIAHMVEETEQYSENLGHRPSRLFRKKM